MEKKNLPYKPYGDRDSFIMNDWIILYMTLEKMTAVLMVSADRNSQTALLGSLYWLVLDMKTYSSYMRNDY